MLPHHELHQPRVLQTLHIPLPLLKLHITLLHIKQLAVPPLILAYIPAPVLLQVLDPGNYKGPGLHLAPLGHGQKRVIGKSEPFDEPVLIQLVDGVPVVDQIVVQTQAVELPEAGFEDDGADFVLGQAEIVEKGACAETLDFVPVRNVVLLQVEVLEILPDFGVDLEF